MTIIILLLSLWATASTDNPYLWDKTYIRDNNVCYLNGKRLSVAVRGFNRNVDVALDSHDRGFGEFAFYSTELDDGGSFLEVSQSKFHLLPLKRDGFDHYKFFYTANSFCNKQHAFRISSNILALLFLKENRPNADKLVIQLFDFKNMQPGKVYDSVYMTDAAEAIPGGFVFRSLSDRSDRETGDVRIEKLKYQFMAKNFSPWVYFTKNGFKTSGSYSYEKFRWKYLFRDKNDFHRASGWDDSSNTFKRPFLYYAINPLERKECVLFTPNRRVIKEGERWRCGSLKVGGVDGEELL